MRAPLIGFLLAAAALSGCVALPERNIELGLTRDAARVEAAQMTEHPVALARPVVVLNGYRGLPTLARRVARNLASMTSGDRGDFLAVSYTLKNDLDEIAGVVVAEVEERWPSDDPQHTVEVDVVAISMGGLVARWAAMAPSMRVRAGEAGQEGSGRGKRLRIARLFTMGTPHRGAVMAEMIPHDPATRDMCAGSPFLCALDEALPGAGYEMRCYTHVGDKMVGATRTAPPGREPIWASGTFWFSHNTVGDNPLFLADIARRLRGEPALLREGAPPPSD